MVIGFRKKFLFIHIPKCAGESISHFLQSSQFGICFLPKHAGYAVAESLMGLEIKRFMVFAVVRNPFDQVLSFYHHLRKSLRMSLEEIESQYPGSGGLLHPLWASELAMRLPFHEFVLAVYQSAIPDKRPDAAWFGDLLTWLKSSDGDLAPVRILRFESLQEDFSNLAGELGLEGELPWRNASGVQAGSACYRDLYDSASRRIIEARFGPTLEHFGYCF